MRGSEREGREARIVERRHNEAAGRENQLRDGAVDGTMRLRVRHTLILGEEERCSTSRGSGLVAVETS
jgi:hypothetical protein